MVWIFFVLNRVRILKRHPYTQTKSQIPPPPPPPPPRGDNCLYSYSIHERKCLILVPYLTVVSIFKEVNFCAPSPLFYIKQVLHKLRHQHDVNLANPVITYERGGTSDFGLLKISDFRLRTSDFQLPTSDFRLPTSDFRFPTSNFNICWVRTRPQKNGGTFQLQEHHINCKKPYETYWAE